MDSEVTEVEALNSGISRAAGVKRELLNAKRMERIEKKLDEILARIGANQVEQRKAK